MCFLLVCVCFVSFFQLNDAAGKDFHCKFISFVQIVQTKLGKKKKKIQHIKTSDQTNHHRYTFLKF